jgi:hypothetical protein
MRAMLEAAEGYAVVDREGKRIGAFVELASDDRIAIRHDGVFVWHRRLLPITSVANVIAEQRAVVLKVYERTLPDDETPFTSPPEASDMAEDDPPSHDAWQDRIHRYLAPVEGGADQREHGKEDTNHEPSAHTRETDQPRSEPDRTDQRTVERHLLFISTSTGYSLIEREGPPPPPGDQLELPEQAISFVVLKLGASPLPNDHRSCAYLAPTA